MRVHGEPRTKLFDPRNTEGEEGSPAIDGLSTKVVTFAWFADGTSTVIDSDWKTDSPKHPQLKEKWTGESWFFKEGCETRPIPRAKFIRPSPGVDVMDENEVIKQLVKQGNYNKENLADCMTTFGLEKVLFQAAQRRCKHLQAYYAVHLALEKGEDPREVLKEDESGGSRGTSRKVV